MDVTPEQLLERAKERFELQDYFGAIHLLEDLIAGGQAFADAHHLLGLCYHLLGQTDRGLAALDQAIALNPRYVDARIHRGVILGELGRAEEAQADFAAAREAGSEARDGIPRHHAAKLANLHATLGEAYAEAGALDRAIGQYETALDLGPSFHDLRYRLGRLLLETGRVLEAKEVLEAVAEARPESAEIQNAVGLAAYLSGDAATARQVWSHVQREHPGDPRASAYLAMLDRGARAES